MPYRFEFRPAVTIASAIMLALLITLGSWQLRRLAWKEGLIAQVEARTNADPIPFAEALQRAEAGENMEYTPVKFSGKIDAGNEANVFGSYEGAAGAFVFAPALNAAGYVVYVNEGFAPLALIDDMQSSAAGTSEGIITGLFRSAEKPTPPASWFQPQGKSADGLWFIRDPRSFSAEAGIEAPSYYIDQFAVEGREWPKGGTTRLEFNNRHLEYALTWFGLAAALVGVWLSFSLKKQD